MNKFILILFKTRKNIQIIELKNDLYKKSNENVIYNKRNRSMYQKKTTSRSSSYRLLKKNVNIKSFFSYSNLLLFEIK